MSSDLSSISFGQPLHLVDPTARLLPKRVVLLRDHLVKELPPLLKA